VANQVPTVILETEELVEMVVTDVHGGCSFSDSRSRSIMTDF
jgi:hypothetical protein